MKKFTTSLLLASTFIFTTGCGEKVNDDPVKALNKVISNYEDGKDFGCYGEFGYEIGNVILEKDVDTGNFYLRIENNDQLLDYYYIDGIYSVFSYGEDVTESFTDVNMDELGSYAEQMQESFADAIYETSENFDPSAIKSLSFTDGLFTILDYEKDGNSIYELNLNSDGTLFRVNGSEGIIEINIIDDLIITLPSN